MQNFQRLRNPHQNIIQVHDHAHQLIRTECCKKEGNPFPVLIAQRAFAAQKLLYGIHKAFFLQPGLFAFLEHPRISRCSAVITVFLEKRLAEGVNCADRCCLDLPKCPCGLRGSVLLQKFAQLILHVARSIPGKCNHQKL